MDKDREETQRPEDENEALRRRVSELESQLGQATHIIQQYKLAEEKLQITLDAIGDALIVTDAKGCVMQLNPVAERLCGWTIDDARGRPVTEVFRIVSALTGEAADNTVEKVLETHEVVALANHTKLISRDGYEYQIADSASPIKDREGRIIGVVLVFRDVTREYNIREALKASEEKYRTIFENTGSGVCIIDEDYTISLVNGHFEKMSGYSAEEVENKMKWPEFVMEEDLERMKEQHKLRREQPGRALNEYEFRFVDKNKQIRYIHLFIEVIPGTRQSVASLLDLTERKRAEEEVERSRDHLQYILNGIDAPIYVADMETHEILFVNESGLAAWGPCLIGKPCYEVLQGMDAPCDFCTNDKLLDAEGKPTGIYLWEFQNKVNGRWYDLHDKAIRWTDGRLVRMEVAIDITERKKTELALQKEKDKFHKITLTAPGTICMFQISDDGQLHVPYADPDIEEVYGYSPEELKRDASLVVMNMPAKDRIRVRKELSACAAKGKPLFTEHKYNHPKKGNVWMELRFAPEKEGDGSITCYGYAINITSIKQQEIKEQLLYDIARANILSGDLEEFSKRVRKSLQVYLNTANFYIALYDKDTELFSLPFEKDEKDNIIEWPAKNSVTGLILEEQKSMLLRKKDIKKLIKGGKIQQVGTMCEAWLGVPLINGGEVMGAIVVQDYDNPDAFNRESKGILEIVSNHISLAVQRQRSFEDLRFQSMILDQIQDKVTVTDLHGKIIYANQAESALFNVSPDKLFGINVSEFGDNKEKGASQEEVIHHTLKKGAWRGEVVNYKEDGSEVYLDVRTTLLHDNKGNEIGLCGVSTDITERKKTTRQLNYHLHFQEMVAKVSSSFVNVHKDNFDEKVNQMLVEIGHFFEVDRTYLFRFSSDYKTMTNTHEWCAEGIPSFMDAMQNFLMEELPWWKEQVVNRKAVRIADVDQLPAEALKERKEFKRQGIQSLLTVPVFGKAAVIGFFGFDSVRTQKNWTTYQVEILKILGNIITDAITKVEVEDKLVEAKEKAEESNRLKSAFLANVSHEIRTPMNAILGFMELLKEPDLENQQRIEFVDIVNKSGQRLLHTINDIIEAAKLESGQVEVVTEKVCISDVMQYFHTLFGHKAKEKNLALRMEEDLPPGAGCIVTDRHKLEGILTNLLSNAIKFTASGHIVLGCYLKDNQLVFYVKDTGVGVREDRQRAIFERFVQADLELSRGYEGSGLGLAIVKAYTDILGGKLWMETEYGKGSTFSVSIPYRQADPVAPSADVKEDKAPVEPGSQKILVAEDDIMSYQYLAVILEKQGLTPLHVMEGKEAVDAVRSNPGITMVLMDWKMPGMNGLEATREIRKFNPDIPIVIQTAHALEGDREKAREAGCTDYISKPIKSDTLVRVLREHLHD